MSADSNFRRMIVLSLEGLARASLGCYGCSWNRTPAIDAIAATGCVWDRLVAQSDELSVLMPQWFQSAWSEPWREFGRTHFVTDSPAAQSAASSCFDNVTRVESDQPSEPAVDLVETQLGRLVGAGVELDQTSEPWSVMWIHSNFLTRCWDAPRELYPVEQLDGDEGRLAPEEADFESEDDRSEESPLELLFDTTEVPRIELGANDHPDWVSSWMRTYACQVRLVDVLTEILLESIQAIDPWFVLLGTSGFRLGQGGWIGANAETLRSADIHLQLVVSDLGTIRCPRLNSSSVIPSILTDLASDPFELTPQQLSSELDQASEVVTESRRAMRAVTTPEWFYVQDNDHSEHLFLKPDDVEDFNDVARVREEVTREFRPS